MTQYRVTWYEMIQKQVTVEAANKDDAATLALMMDEPVITDREFQYWEDISTEQEAQRADAEFEAWYAATFPQESTHV